MDAGAKATGMYLCRPAKSREYTYRCVFEIKKVMIQRKVIKYIPSWSCCMISKLMAQKHEQMTEFSLKDKQQSSSKKSLCKTCLMMRGIIVFIIIFLILFLLSAN